MSILLDNNSVCLIQGITGKQGTSIAEDMLSYNSGVQLVAGVTPGKGGQDVHGVPVFNTIEEAKAAHTDINVTLVSTPPAFTKAAIIEAIESSTPLIVVLTEGVPMSDTAYCLAEARLRGLTIVGPASIGIITPGVGKVGVIFGSEPNEIVSQGNIGLVSKSGGMTAELALILKNGGFGVSTALSIGGDVLAGSTYADILKLFEKDDQTKAVAMYGELGGIYEEQAAELIESGEFTKPLVAFIAGKFAEKHLPQGHQLGHAGAIVEGNKGTTKSKIDALQKAGAYVVDVPYDIPQKLEELL